MLKALDQFGFGSLDLAKEDFLDPGQVIQFGVPPNRIDIFSDLKGISFKKCYPAKAEIKIDGVTVFFIDLENLKKNKKASARYQDLADLENLGGLDDAQT